jgi:hypothetical protein
MSNSVVAVTTEQSGDLSLTGVGTALRASTRVHDDDGGSSFGTERDAVQSISVKDSSAIIEGTANSGNCIGGVEGSERCSARTDLDTTCVGQGIPLRPARMIRTADSVPSNAAPADLLGQHPWTRRQELSYPSVRRQEQ